MEKIKKNNVVLIVAILVLVLTVGFTKNTTVIQKKENELKGVREKLQANMFVTHGHCSTPFIGDVNNLKVAFESRNDKGNPLENMKISFDIDPKTFNVCASKELTQQIKTKGLFIDDRDSPITFRTEQVFTMGMDWCQVNGVFSIKRIEKKVNFFVTGIRNSNETEPTSLVLEGRLNLFDWGIDYNKIVGLDAQLDPSKWMHINMQFSVDDNTYKSFPDHLPHFK